MKINRVETLRLEEFSNLLFGRIHSDEGFVGLGETFPRSAAHLSTNPPKTLVQETVRAFYTGWYEERTRHRAAGATPPSRRAPGRAARGSLGRPLEGRPVPSRSYIGRIETVFQVE